MEDHCLKFYRYITSWQNISYLCFMQKAICIRSNFRQKYTPSSVVPWGHFQCLNIQWEDVFIKCEIIVTRCRTWSIISKSYQNDPSVALQKRACPIWGSFHFYWWSIWYKSSESSWQELISENATLARSLQFLIGNLSYRDVGIPRQISP